MTCSALAPTGDRSLLLRLTMIISLFVASSGVAVSAGKSDSSATAPKAYTLGVFPHLSVKKLRKVFTPITVVVAEAVNRPVKLRSAPTFEEFQLRLARGEYDIAYIQPFDYVKIAQPHEYVALAARDENLKSVLVVTGDSFYKSFEELMGKDIAMPPASAAVSQIFENSLINAKINPFGYFNILRVDNHASCLHLLDKNLVAACVTAVPPLIVHKNRTGKKYRIIHQSDPYPHVLFVAHSRVPALERKRLRDRLISLSFDDIGRPAAFSSAKKETLFRPADDSDYDIYRRLEAIEAGSTRP